MVLAAIRVRICRASIIAWFVPSAINFRVVFAASGAVSGYRFCGYMPECQNALVIPRRNGNVALKFPLERFVRNKKQEGDEVTICCFLI